MFKEDHSIIIERQLLNTNFVILLVTVKKAIKILDWWINQREQQINKLETEYKFNDSEIQRVLFESEKTIIDNLKLIKKELVPNCKHPKKMRDICGKIEYCMSCNLDM